jgi:hypothetical protein
MYVYNEREALTDAEEQPLRVNVIGNRLDAVRKLVRIRHEMASRQVAVGRPSAVHVDVAPTSVAKAFAHHDVSNLHQPGVTEAAAAVRAVVAEMIPTRPPHRRTG